MMETVDMVIPGVCGLGMHLRLDGFRLIYVSIAVIMWVSSGLFSLEYMRHYEERGRYYLFFWLTLPATAGVFLSADLYTAFIFFEIMSFTSYVWVAFDRKKESLRAAQTYLAVAVIGGMVMLMGLFLLYSLLGTLEMDELGGAAARLLADGSQASGGATLESGGMSPAAGRAFLESGGMPLESGGMPLESGGMSLAAGGMSPAAGRAFLESGGMPLESGGMSLAAGGVLQTAGRLYAACGLVLFGFGAKAGCFPLHIWLPKAHPVAPAPASALLSGILTKAGVFGVIVISCNIFGSDGGWGLLIASLGLVTMFLGALLALFSINLKRTLACSSVSQIGFIFTGIGMSCLLKAVGEDNSLAVRGAFLHMVNHSLFKLVLFLCAGAVFMNLHQLDLNDIRGFGRRKPALLFCFLMGALGLSGIPMWSGYVSKTLLHEGIVEYGDAIRAGAAGAGHMVPAAGNMWNKAGLLLTSPGLWTAFEWLFLITGGMTAAYMAKLFIALFVERHPSRQAEFDAMSGKYMTPASCLALVVPSIVLPVMGLFPRFFMDSLADCGQGFFRGDEMSHPVSYFSPGNLKGALISVGIGAAIYVLVVRGFLMKRDRTRPGVNVYVDRWPVWLDLEELVYRPVIQTALPAVFGAVCQAVDRYLLSVPLKVVLAVSGVVCRAMDQMTDGIILLARKTTHRQSADRSNAPGSDRLACALGQVIDRAAQAGRFLPGRRRRSHSSVIPGLMEAEEELRRTGRMVEESFSFGLMLFCIGLCLTLGYLLAVFFRG